MLNTLSSFDLKANPFEPAATGTPLGSSLELPVDLKTTIEGLLDAHENALGVKAFPVVGEYGCGKTCLLRWLERQGLPARQIQPFYFDNPGVQFYDLANSLLRQIGRKDFAKLVWELAGPKVNLSYQKNMFQQGYEEYLSSVRTSRQEKQLQVALQSAIRESAITQDEEIAFCLARIVTESRAKPYFEYRDFIPSRIGSVVAESEEPTYFRALLKVLTKAKGANSSAFLIDEFEEIGLQKRLSKRASHDYLSTLKRLINLTQHQDSNLWLFLSMTPDAYETTKSLDPALDQRFREDSVIQIQPFDQHEAIRLVKDRLKSVRIGEDKYEGRQLFPFPETLQFDGHIYSNPRRLVKACFFAISQASSHTGVPFSKEYLQEMQEKVYPHSDSN